MHSAMEGADELLCFSEWSRVFKAVILDRVWGRAGLSAARM